MVLRGLYLNTILLSVEGDRFFIKGDLISVIIRLGADKHHGNDDVMGN